MMDAGMKVSLRKFGLLSVSLALATTGCSRNVEIGGDPQLNIASSVELPTPSRVAKPGDPEPYLVGPFDKLTIDVFGIEELQEREIQVDASGRMSFPMAGVVAVQGLTPAEVEDVLEARLREAFVRNPQVTVNLKEAVSRVITVGGQVKRPGIYPIVGQMTLLRAIARAEGVDEFSNLEDVIVFRSVNGQRYAGIYNAEAIRRGAYPDPAIYADDVVMVGDSAARRRFKDVLALMPALLTPLVIAIDRFSN